MRSYREAKELSNTGTALHSKHLQDAAQFADEDAHVGERSHQSHQTSYQACSEIGCQEELLRSKSIP